MVVQCICALTNNVRIEGSHSCKFLNECILIIFVTVFHNNSVTFQ